MIRVTKEVWDFLDRRLNRASVPEGERPAYRKWVRYYLDFCGRYGHPPRSASSVDPFVAKLASKNQSPTQRKQAARAIALLIAKEMVEEDDGTSPADGRPAKECGQPRRSPVSGTRTEMPSSAAAGGDSQRGRAQSKPADLQFQGAAASWEEEYRELEGAIRMRNYSGKTLASYRLWVRKFQAFTKSKPAESLEAEVVKGFLTDLAVRRQVAGSTQNQAFNALLFFFRHVVGREFGKLDGVVRAKRRPYVPVVLSRTEVDAVVGELGSPYRLVAMLLYGCGLRLSECLELRVHCFNLDATLLTVHDGKGQKDRSVPLPERLLPDIRGQMDRVRSLHRDDVSAGYSGVFLPRQLERKYRKAATEFIWQWFFPAPTLTVVPGAHERRRYHLHGTHVQAAVKQAATRAGIPQKGFRRTRFATRSRVTFCWPTTISRRSRSCWATATSRRR